MNGYYTWNIWDKNKFVCGGVASSHDEAEHKARLALSQIDNKTYHYSIGEMKVKETI